MGIFPMQQADPWAQPGSGANPVSPQRQTTPRQSGGVTVTPYGGPSSAEIRAQEAAERARLEAIERQRQNAIANANTANDDARAREQNTWTVMSQEESAAQGLPQGVIYQRNGLGEVRNVGGQAAAPLAGSVQQARNAQALLTMAGVTEDSDPIADLISGSTSGGLQSHGADFAGFFGVTTPGQESIAQLETLTSAMVMQLMNGSLGTGISNADRDFIVSQVGNLSDDTQPAERRLAAWQQVRQRLNNLIGANGQPASAPGAVTPGSSVQSRGDDPRELDENGQPIGSWVTVTADTPPPPPTPPTRDGLSALILGDGTMSIPQQLGAGVGDIVQGVGDIIGMVGANPIGQMMYNAMGRNETYDAGNIMRNASGLPESQNDLYSSINRGITGAMVPAGMANQLMRTVANPTARGALATIGQTPMRDIAAGAGAGAGAYAGEQIGGTPGAIVGALAGGVGGYGLASGAARRIAGTQPSQIVRDAGDLNIDLMPADAGSTGTRMAAGVVGRTLGNIPMVEGAQNSVLSARTARNAIARDVGDYGDDATVGQATRRGVEAFRASSGTRGEELLDAIPIEAGAAIQLASTRATLADMNTRMSSNPRLAQVWRSDPRLRESLAALEENPNVSWGDLRQLRSTVGEIIGQPSMASEGKDISAMRGLYASLTADMEAAASAAGPRALTAFRRHNQYYRGREKRLQDVFSTLLGPSNGRSDERVAVQLNNWARRDGGDFSRLARTMRSMPREERETISSSIIARMGRASPGQQTEAGEAFSPARWATEWQAMSNRAKSVLFPNSEHRQALDKFARVTEGMRASDQYANYSMTSLGSNAIALGATAFASAPAAIGLAGMSFGAGKLLASPAFARLIGRVPQGEAGLRKWNEQLGVLASREAGLAAPVRELQRAMNDNIPRVSAAASPDETEEEKQRRQAILR